MDGSETTVIAGHRVFTRPDLPVAQLGGLDAAAVRARLDQWFERVGVRPRVVGEFEDSALLKTFGAGGMGVFPATELVHDELMARYDVKRVGPCDGVEQHFFAIGTEKKVLHPLVQRLLPVRH